MEYVCLQSGEVQLIMNQERKHKGIDPAVVQAAEALVSAGAREVYVFGSATQNALGKNSDIDFAVVGLRPESYFHAMVMAEDAAHRTIDLLDLEEDSPFTKFLKKKGQLVRVA